MKVERKMLNKYCSAGAGILSVSCSMLLAIYVGAITIHDISYLIACFAAGIFLIFIGFIPIKEELVKDG